ncbi:MAG: hypothetical protein JWM57_2537, partial [Phycisphaerales bacterium]|nr:hypothetical protein [Phycisphaerales bacterium]
MFSAAYTVTDLAPDLNGVEHTGHAYGISDDGTKVAGEYDGHATVWTNGVRKDLGFTGYAKDVNNSGVVVGLDTTAGETGFIWKSGVETTLTLPGNAHGIANAINNNNVVAGTINIGGVQHAVVSGLNGAAKDLGVPSGGYVGSA